MIRLNAAQWAFVIAFQIAFGAIVYGLTRAYYAPEFNVEATSAAASSGDPVGRYNEMMDQELKRAGNDAEQISRVADQFFAQKRYDRAAEAYLRLVELKPNDVEVYNNVGLVLHYLGRSADAANYLEQGTRVDPRYQRIWLTLGFVKSGSGDVGGARLAFQKAMEIDPESGIGVEAKAMIERLQ